MAEVPGAGYQPFSTATPTERPIPLRGPDVSGAAFGENIARALQTFGGDVKEGANELWTRAVALQDLKNEQNAREAMVAFTQSAAGKQENYLLTRERTAQDGLQPHLDDIEKTRQQFRGTLDNPAARAKFDADAASVQNYYTRAAAAHAAQGGREYVTGGNKAALDNISGAWANYQDPHEFTDKIRRGEGIIRQNDALENKSMEEVEDDIRKWNQRVRGSQILGLSWDHPTDAMLLLETHKGDLDPEVYNNIRKQVENRFETVVGDRLSDEIVARNRAAGKSVEDSVDDAKELVKNDPIARQIPGIESRISQQVRSKYRGIDYDQRQDTYTDQQVILNALAAPDANYKSRAQLEESDPRVKASIRNLGKTKEGAAFLSNLDARITKNWNVHHSDQQDENYRQLRGEADSRDPRVREMYLQHTADFHEFDLKKGDWKDLMARRARILANPEQENPIVNYSMGIAKKWFGSTLRELNIDKLTDDNAEIYHKYTGSLSIAIDEWMQNHENRRPDDTQIREQILAPLLRERSEGGIGGWFTHKRGFFDFDLKPDTMRQYKEQESGRMSGTYGVSVTPEQVSDEEAYQAASRDVWKKLFEKPDGGNTTVPSK